MVKEQIKNKIRGIVEKNKSYSLENMNVLSDVLGDEIRISIVFKKLRFSGKQAVKNTNRKIVEQIIKLLCDSELQNYKLNLFIFEKKNNDKKWRLRFSTKEHPVKKLDRFCFAGMAGIASPGYLLIQEK